ncbi:PPK2 family polyphosphate kinase [Rubrobacter marinus]|uniref:PPK2 family polyphosphate kinase n=1 Tax=Rubrobacter marinus TaxID=2653852 RepID=UPI001A9CE084|nr:PPK2 family polyphosphate kinase [Rubrobacter marinus]
MGERYHERYRVEPSAAFRLDGVNPEETQGLRGKEARGLLAGELEKLSGLQERLYAEGKRSLLLVLQAMDGGGKDSTIRRVFRGVNPQGCYVVSFKAPSQEELAHDFLWRIHRRTPARGHIGVFNRSHYEDVLVPLVHETVPASLVEGRYEHINCLEKMLHDSGTRLVKVFLHISKEYQLKRMHRRLERPDKLWKFALEDLEEREHWDAYMGAYETLSGRCSTPRAPWCVVPANNRRFSSIVVAQLLVDALREIDPQHPPAFDPEQYPTERLQRG